MPDGAPETFDEFERHVGETMKAWSPAQRLAFITALAERWISAYEAFSATEGWGDPVALRQTVAAVWDHIRGQPITPANAARFAEQIWRNAPDSEEFDNLSAWKALHACLILGLALECCENTENEAIATKAALASFEAALGDWPSDKAGQRRAWKKVAARGECARQCALIEAIRPIARFDEHSVSTLRSGLSPAQKSARARSPSKRKRVDNDSIDGWRFAVGQYLKRTPTHRIAFAASLAERLLPSYHSFAATTGDGQPDLLREVLDAVWKAAKGHSITPRALEEHQTKLQAGSVCATEPDAWEAWCAWRVLELALACCGEADNTELAGEAAVVAFELVAGPDARTDPRAWKDQHSRPGVHDEIMNQMMLLTRLSSIPALDGPMLEKLRHGS